MFFDKKNDDDLKVIDEILSTDSFTGLKINFKSSDLKLKAGNHFEIRYHGEEYRKPIVESDQNVTTVREPDVKSKEISRWEKGLFKIEIDRRSQSEVTITVPAELTLSELNILLMSGDSDLGKLKIHKFNYESMSGDLNIKEAKIDNLDISSTSGDIDFDQIKIVDGKVNLTSGDFEMLDSRISNKLRVETVSGDNLVKRTQVANCKLSSVSGSNTINHQKSKEGSIGIQDGSVLKMTTISGDNRVEANE